jgi:hypothetical protein
VREVGWKDDGGGNHGTGQRSAAGFVDAGDSAGALLEKTPLELESVNVSPGAAGSRRRRCL